MFPSLPITFNSQLIPSISDPNLVVPFTAPTTIKFSVSSPGIQRLLPVGNGLAGAAVGVSFPNTILFLTISKATGACPGGA